MKMSSVIVYQKTDAVSMLFAYCVRIVEKNAGLPRDSKPTKNRGFWLTCDPIKITNSSSSPHGFKPKIEDFAYCVRIVETAPETRRQTIQTI